MKKKRRKKEKKLGKAKAAGEGLEGFVDWVDLITSEPIKERDDERDDEMSSLAVGFIVRMHKQAASA